MPRRVPVCFALLAALSGQPIVFPAQSHATNYELEVEILPTAGTLAAAARITVARDDYLAPTVSFALHEALEIGRVSVGGEDVEFTVLPGPDDPHRPASKTVVVSLPEELRRPTTELEVLYGGPLGSAAEAGGSSKATALDDTIGGHRVELAWYSSWYPQFAPFGTAFGVDLAITLPAGWTMACTGELEAEEDAEDGRRRSRWRARSAVDIVVVGSPELSRLEITDGEAAVEIYSTRLPEAFLEREADTVRRTLDLYRDLLGAPVPDGSTVRVVYSPRAGGQGGYSRAPMVVLSEGRVLAALKREPRLSLLRGTAHEAAHFWFSFGTGQGDWINESLAEYFSWLAVERIDSIDRYREIVAGASRVVDELPPDAPSLSEVPPSNEGHGQTIRYHKGALMLEKLRRILGDAEFFDACRSFFQTYRGRSATTEDFRSFWGARLGEDRSDVLNLWLMSTGGLPSGRS